MLKIDIIDSVEKLGPLRDAWNDALSRSRFDNVHLTWEWFYAWCDSFKKQGLCVIIIKEIDRILAIVPFEKTRDISFGMPVKRIKALRNPYSTCFDFILTERESECTELIFRYLDTEGWDVMELGHMSLDSKIVCELEKLDDKGRVRLYKDRVVEKLPYISVRGNWEDYFKTLSGHFRSNMRYSEKKLEDMGGVRLAEVNDSSEIDKSLEKFFHIEASGWKGEKKTAITCSNDAKRFYDRLAGLAGEKGWLKLFF